MEIFQLVQKFLFAQQQSEESNEQSMSVVTQKKILTEFTTNRGSPSKGPGTQNHKSSSLRSHSIANHNKVNRPSINSKTILGPIPQQIVKTSPRYTYFVGRGNNEALIKKILNERGCWTEIADSTSTFVNFKWQQDMKGYRYNRLVDSGLYRSVLNHFEFHQCLCNKQFLFKNLEAYCQKYDQHIWDIVPPTFVLNAKDECNMQFLKQFTDFYIKHFPKELKQKRSDYEKQANEARRKLKNYFYNSNEKKNISKMPSMGTAFINQELGGYLWIIKPTFLNRGRGIQVFSELVDLLNFVNENVTGYIEKSMAKQEVEQKKIVDYIKRNSEQVKLLSRPEEDLTKSKRQNNFERKDMANSLSSTFDGNQYIRVIPKVPALIRTDCFLIQKYLERPLLIKNRKFDIRMWVLVTQNLVCYVFREGYIRLSSQEYTCQGAVDNSIHLTNNAVQKFSGNYGKLVEGNQMSFRDLKSLMQQNKLDFDICLSIINRHIEKSLSATQKKLNPLNRKFVFQVFGYDFMIDETGYPWLIEVNNNPCIEQSSQIVSKLLHRMLDDAFKLTIDLLFPGATNGRKYPVQGYSDSENMWKQLNIRKTN